MKNTKIKLAYIVTESGCMNKHTGAYQHIQMGIKELSRHFEVVPLLPTNLKNNKFYKRKTKKISKIKKSGLWGFFRDIKDFCIFLIRGLFIANELKKLDIKIVYLRVQGLNPLSLYLRLCGYKVFLEANSLQFESRQKRFSSYISFLYKPFERFVYKCSTHTFFIGSYGCFWNLKEGNWTNIENGIEENHPFHINKINTGSKKLKIAILARFVDHHNGIFFSNALNIIDKKLHDLIELHLIGEGYDNLIEILPATISYKEYGFLSREQMPETLNSIHIGLIPDAPNYQSQMKLFDYAASGCLVLAPNTAHFKRLYTDKGILFFEKESPNSLARSITDLLLNKDDLQSMADMFQFHIKENYTWEKIFMKKVDIIKSFMQA